VFALGGLSPADLADAQAHGAHGVGGCAAGSSSPFASGNPRPGAAASSRSAGRIL
jgi:hypothetical protein